MQDEQANIKLNTSQKLEAMINTAWIKIPPFWPIKNMVAVNPLIGFEDLPFPKAIAEAERLFQHPDLPEPMQTVNRESIKWLQAFYDEGQATIRIPGQQDGLLSCVKNLLLYDKNLISKEVLTDLPQDPLKLTHLCLQKLDITEDQQGVFLTLALTTLPGWASHVLYRSDWSPEGPDHRAKLDYIAFRLMLMLLYWPNAKDLLVWYKDTCQSQKASTYYQTIQANEAIYREKLFDQLSKTPRSKPTKLIQAQFVFCIDVRSEPFRRHLEHTGHYETFGFAGFFGLPITIEDHGVAESYPSCPVLIQPQYTVCQTLHHQDAMAKRVIDLKKVYQSTKYTFTSSFALVEGMGFLSGIWMGWRTFFPRFAGWIKNKISKSHKTQCPTNLDLGNIPLNEQVDLGANALRMMGLTRDFAPLVFLCGHGSESQNNAYAAALDCGACGGRPGGINARFLATILNNPGVRLRLQDLGIAIPKTTYFVPAQHNTTTDVVDIIDTNIPKRYLEQLNQINHDLDQVRVKNCAQRDDDLDHRYMKRGKAALKRAVDWSQVRPEWGLARNASFIVAPRWITESIDLQGRSFLHSYDWTLDQDSQSLLTILTAPVVVGYWINSQYLFSTLDPIAYGAGSKVTKNITGKFAVTQGNASDLMQGLPIQSVHVNPDQPYHEPLRLTVVVHAPRSVVLGIVANHELLTKLVSNEWIHMVALDPQDFGLYKLGTDLKWIRS